MRARLSLDLGVPLLEQLVGADLLTSGEALLAHRREQLRTSRDAALRGAWPSTCPSGGSADPAAA